MTSHLPGSARFRLPRAFSVGVAAIIGLVLFFGHALPAQAEAPWNVVQISTGTGAAMTNPVIADGYAVWVEQVSPSYKVYLRDLSAGTTTCIATQSTTGDPYIGDGYVVWGAGDGVYLYDIASGTPGSPVKISPLPGAGATVDGGYVVWNHTEGAYYETVWLYSINDGITRFLSDRVAADVWARVENGHVIWQSQTLDPHGWQLKLYDIASDTTKTLDDVIYENCTNEDQGAYIEGGRVLWMAQDASDYWQVYVYDIALDSTTQITSDPYDHQCARIAGDWVTYCTVTSATPGSESDEIWLYNLVTGDATRICSTASTPAYFIADNRPRVDATGNVVWERSWQNLDPAKFSDSASEILFFSTTTGQTSYITPQYVPGVPQTTQPMFTGIDGGQVVFWSQPDSNIYLATQAQTNGVTYTSIRGSHRYHTAQLISQAMFPGALPPGSGVVVAPGTSFQEALCGAPLAAAWGGPVLLTPTAGLEKGTRAELIRLAPSRVFCIGLSDAVAKAVRTALPTATVTTIRGTWGSVYDMSHRVAHELAAKVGNMTSARAILTIGTNFPDAIGASALACANLWPIVLTGTGTTAHPKALATFSELGITKALKLGTYAGLPRSIVYTQLSGADRYATNRNVADWAEANGGLSFTHIGFATGDKFPDALAAGPYLALDDGMLLLSPLTGPLPPAVGSAVTANQADVRHVTYIAMIQPVVGQVKALLPGPPRVTGIGPASGPAAGGTTVTIAGANFTGASNVRFGSAPATSFTVHSATRITATSPAGSSTVDITVVGPTGTSAAGLADRFRYIPLPVVTGLAPTSGTIRGGTEVTITGTGFMGATAVTFGATPAAHFSVDSSTRIRATSPAHATGLVDVTVTAPGGTSAAADANDDFTFALTPEITGLAPTWGPEAGGFAVSITGANFTGTTWVKFGDTDAAGVTLVSDTEITAWSPPHAAGPVHVSVITTNGTSLPTDPDLYRFGSPVRFEQDDPLLVYSATWSTVTDGAASAGSSAQTVSAGAVLDISFTGTSLDWIATKGTAFGRATVSLDGATPVTVDLSSATTEYQQPVWTSGPLPEGPHTVIIASLGEPGAAGTGLAVNVDAFDVVGALTEFRDGLLVVDGSSLAESDGSAPGNGWASRATAALNSPTAGVWILRNVAHGGQNIAQMAADAATQIDTLYSAAYQHNIVCVWEGTISLSNGYTAARYVDELKAYCLARRAAGFQVVVVTVLPCYGRDNSAVNALIRAGWTDYADALADIALDPRIGDAGDEFDLTYYLADTSHLTDAGNAIVGDIVRAAIEGIL